MAVRQLEAYPLRNNVRAGAIHSKTLWEEDQHLHRRELLITTVFDQGHGGSGSGYIVRVRVRGRYLGQGQRHSQGQKPEHIRRTGCT